jgi:hypothetical protein
LAVLMCGALLLPYALAGWYGAKRYLMVEALFWLIAALLFLAVLMHHLILGRAPTTRAGRVIRMVVDTAGAVGIVAATYWPLPSAG